jgi:hypothetical protein
MYKGASQSLQKKHAVDKPHPSRGYIDGPPDARDVLPAAETMTLQQAEDERERLKAELAVAVRGLSIAKVGGHEREIRRWGQRHADIQTRLFAINSRIKTINKLTSGDPFRRACEEILAPKTIARIVTRAIEIQMRAASGMNAFGQDPKGLEAKPASPAPKGDAQ